MESLCNQIYSDLNRVSELQGDMNRTFNRIPFSPESWDYFVLKLCGGFGLTLHLLDERLLKYRLTSAMARTKFGVSQTVELVRIDDTTTLEDLRRPSEHPWGNYCGRRSSKKSNVEAQVQAA
jgi:hypothetical protein